jgi:putative membrane protein
MTAQPRKPMAFRLSEGDRAPEHQEPAPVKRRAPRALPASRIRIEPEFEAETETPAGPDPSAFARPLRWGSLLVVSLAALAALAAGLALNQLIADLFARSAVLGWTGGALLSLAVFAALAIVVREIVGLARLARLGSIREDAVRAIDQDDEAAASQTLAALKRIYGGRRELAAHLALLAEHEAAIMDPADRVRLAERDLLLPVDEEAGRLIAAAARRVTLLTAVTPAAALDIVFVAVQNLRMLRGLATLYGGRPGSLGTLRLARMVVAHLAVAGGLALSDQVLQHLIGRGLVGRLSARFGEGAVNGILTARIGLAALDLCRPLPFTIAPRPNLVDFLSDVVKLGSTKEAGAAPAA